MTRRRIRTAAISAVVIIIVAAGGYFGYTRFLGNQSTASDLSQFGIDASQEVQVIAVRRGNLSNAVSINGSLRYATRETIGIPFSGKVKDVQVEVGDRVQTGDVLLVMDEAALIEANKTYREAEVNLQNAQKALDELLEPPAETIDDAEFKIKNAEHALATAEEALNDALDPDGAAQKKARKDVEAGHTAVEDAADAITTAQDAIKDAEDAVETAQQAVPDAENAITNSQLALRTAEKAITDHDKAITQTDIDNAQQTLSRAQRDLELAQSARTDTLAKSDASIRTATRAYKDAYDEYNAVWQRWLGIDLADHEVVAPETLLTKLNIHLESLFGRVAKQLATEVPIDEIGRPLPLDDPETPYNEQLVTIWLRFNAPEVIVDCGPYPQTSSRLCILKEFDDAWDKLLPLKEALDTAQTQAERTKEDADRSIIDAEQAIETAQKALNDLMPSPERDQERADLVTRRDLAQEDVEKAERQLTNAQDQVQKARDAVQTARDNLAKAEDKHRDTLKDLAELEAEERRVADPNTNEKKTLRLDIESKQLDLAKVRKELADLRSPTLAEIELKRAELATAQRAFDDAQIPDAQGEVVATFDGIVGQVHVKDNEEVAKDQDAVVVADPASVEMRGSVDEVDVLFLQVGDQAEVETDALAGQTIVGTITDIAAFGSTTSGTVFGADFEQDVGSVSYPVTIGIQAPPGTTLPEGLSARGQVVIRDIQNVLLVPVGAIFGTQQEPQLLVQTGTDPLTYEFKPVVLGVSDDFWTELISGVDEGDDILMTVVGGSQIPDFGF